MKGPRLQEEATGGREPIRATVKSCRGGPLTGRSLSSERLAFSALRQGIDLEEVGRSRQELRDLCEGIPRHGQLLPMFPWAVHWDHLHAVARDGALRGTPHDGDFDVCDIHELQIFGGRNLTWGVKRCAEDISH